LVADFIIEADNSCWCYGQAEEVLEDTLDVVVGDFDFMAKERSESFGVGADVSLRDFILGVSGDDFFTDRAPVIEVEEAGINDLYSDILLDMMADMFTERDIRVVAERAFVQGSDYKPVYMERFFCGSEVGARKERLF